MAAITEKYGQIDAVEFSPVGGNMGDGIEPVLDVDPENLQLVLDRFLLSGVTLVRAVLPGMVERGDGAILFTASQPGIHHNLNTVLADKGSTSARSKSAR